MNSSAFPLTQSNVRVVSAYSRAKRTLHATTLRWMAHAHASLPASARVVSCRVGLDVKANVAAVDGQNLIPDDFAQGL